MGNNQSPYLPTYMLRLAGTWALAALLALCPAALAAETPQAPPATTAAAPQPAPAQAEAAQQDQPEPETMKPATVTSETAPAALPTPQEGTPCITRLPNGLAVYVLADKRFPLVSTRLFVRAGSSLETPEQAGISHLLEHMVFKGTQRRPKGAISQAVEAVGGYLNAYTSFDRTVYLTDMPAEHWALGMDIVRDMAFNAAILPEDLASEQDVVIAELKRGLDNPHSRLFDTLLRQCFAGTAYERPIIGFENTVRAQTPESLRAYINQHYQPQNCLLLVVGNVDPIAVIREAERQFGGLANTTPVPRLPAVDTATLPDTLRVEVNQGPWNKVYLGMALPSLPDGDAETVTLDVLADLLGGDATSYLYRRYKYEKQLVDNISVANMSFARAGMLGIFVELAPDKLEAFWQEFTRDLGTLKPDFFTPEDLARAKLQQEDGIYRTQETMAAMASWRGQNYFENGAVDDRNLLHALRQVSAEDVRAAMARWLTPARMSVAVQAPANAKLPDLQAIAAASWQPAPTRATASAAMPTGATETVDLGHGRTLVLIPDTSLPYIAVDMFFSGGESLARPSQQGLASLTAKVLLTGAAGRSAPDTERYLADRAAGLSASAGRQSFAVSLRAPERFAPELFTLFRDTLKSPNLAPEEVAREKREQIAGIRASLDRPLGLAFNEIPGLLFPRHPYGYKRQGTLEGVAAYEPDDVRMFWKAQVAQPWVLAVAGAFDREAVLAFARSLPVPEEKGVNVDAPQWGENTPLQLHLPGRQQAHLFLVFRTVPLEHPDSMGLDVLENVLSGQSGTLFTELRDNQGLGYTVTAGSMTAQRAGYLYFYIGTDPSKLEQAREGFARVIERLKTTPLPADEVNKAANQIRGDYYRGHQTIGSRSSEAASLGILGQPLDLPRTRMDAAAKVTPEQLQRLARTYLDVDMAYVVTVTP